MNTVVRIVCIFAMAVVGTAAQQKSLVAPRDFIIGADTFIWEPTSNGNGQALFDTSGAVIPEKMAAYDK